MESTRPLSNREYRIGLVLISLFALWVYMPGIERGYAVGDIMLLVPELSFTEMLNQIIVFSRAQAVYWLFNWGLSKIFVDTPMAYRLVLLALHVLTGVVLSDLAKRMTGDSRVGLAAFLLFALYPRNHQVLMWTVSNNKVPGTLLFLLCMDFTLQYRQENRKRQGMLAVVFAVLALFTSGGNIALFILLPLMWNIFSEEDLVRHKALTRKALVVLAVLAAGYALLTYEPGQGFRFMPGSAVPVSGLSDAYKLQPLGLPALKDFLVYNMYLLVPFIPLRSLDPNVTVSLLAGVCFFFLVAAFGVGVKLPRLAAVWMVVGILPYVLFVPTGNADRYFYLAAVGYALLAGRLIIRLYDLNGQPGQVSTLELVLICLLGIYAVAGTLMIRARVDEWRTAERIASRVVEDTLYRHPGPLEGHQMLYVDLPMTYGQAYLYLSGGISREISQAYLEEKGVAVEAYQVSDPEVIKYVKSLPNQTWGTQGDLTIFLYENGGLVEKDSTSADLDLLKPALWIR